MTTQATTAVCLTTHSPPAQWCTYLTVSQAPGCDAVLLECFTSVFGWYDIDVLSVQQLTKFIYLNMYIFYLQYQRQCQFSYLLKKIDTSFERRVNLEVTIVLELCIKTNYEIIRFR